MDHEDMMRDAINVAREAASLGEAPIGAVIYSSDGRKLAQGWNQRRSTGDKIRHAELVAFSAIAQPGVEQSENLVIASTLEPCVMCWGACLNLRCAKILYGLEAPDDGGSKRVTDQERQCQVAGGILREQCRQLFIEWFEQYPDADGAEYVSRLLERTD